MRKRDIIEKNEQIVNIKFEGKNIIAYEGETVAEALFANGIDFFMLSNKYFRPRGLFCKDGKCGQCKMNIDGNRNALACRTFVREGISVKRNIPKLSIKDLKNFSFYLNLPFFIFLLKNLFIQENRIQERKRIEEYSTEILIIGGGSAGNSAFNTIKKFGGNVILVNDGPISAESSENALAFENMNIFSIEGKTAYGISEKRIIKINANKIIIATGSYNIDRPFKNNDVPGIMLFSEVKNLIEKNIKPGKNAVIIGSSGEEEGIANFLQSKGVKVKGIITENLYKSKYDLFYFYKIEKAVGYRKLNAILIGKGKMLKKINCDLLIFTDKSKNLDLVLNVNGKIAYSREKHSFFPVRDKNLTISKDIYYAGNFSDDESLKEGEKAAILALNITKKKNERILEIVGVKNENNMQIYGYNG
mgnify:CR=1 FL=1